MTLIHILVFILLALISGGLATHRQRPWFLVACSILAVFWLQPATPLRHFDFWLPMATIAITLLVWFRVRFKTSAQAGENRRTLVLVALTTLIIAGTRYLPLRIQITTTLPPQIPSVLLALIFITGLISVTLLFEKPSIFNKVIIVFVLILFIVLKNEALTLSFNRILRSLNRQEPGLASVLDLPWLGFSYLAFRLLHILRDHAIHRLPPMTLREYVSYVLYFPALTAGPIDRAERFIKDLRKPSKLDAQRFYAAGKRISIGLLKKFVLADSLAIIALNETNANQVSSSLWLWVLLYAFAFQIYLDFSGYTDVAIGIGILTGIDLPENFNLPYLQTNIGEFWNRWHMTLAQWFRFYFFNPLTRALRESRWDFPVWLVILLGQVSTLTLIGLWHGISLNFFVWGLWHGIGLFVHNRWAAWLRAHPSFLGAARDHLALRVVSTFLTFQFVALGWVWFALPNMEISWQVLRRLIGI